jgi:ABC-type transporter Mla subunit MlaD
MTPLVKVEADIAIHIHGTDHSGRSHEILKKLGDLVAIIQQLQGKVSTMATKADFDALVASVNTATNNIATRIAALEAKIATGGMTADEEAGVLSELSNVRQSLEALGADPNNPVPPEI